MLAEHLLKIQLFAPATSMKSSLLTVKRSKLNWSMNPIPSIHTKETLKQPSALKAPPEGRKLQKSVLINKINENVLTKKTQFLAWLI